MKISNGVKKSKILIIEDDRFLLKLYSDKLRRAGFEIIEAISGEEGFSKIMVEKPDLVILDLVLSRKSGLEILNDMKLKDEIRDIPVIIVTNLEQTSDIEKGLGLGAIAYLVKADFSINKLPETVKRYLKEAKKK